MPAGDIRSLLLLLLRNPMRRISVVMRMGKKLRFVQQEL
jgi:hypothetical protein